MAKKKQIRNVLCFLVMIGIFMSLMPVSVFAVNDSDNTTGVSNPLNALENTFTEKSPSSGDCAPVPDADLPEIYLNDTQECVLSWDSGNGTNILFSTDISNGTHETVSALSCDVYVKIDDPCCVGYRVYVDGAYQFTEGGDGTTPDGFCAFYVCAGTHTIKITKNGRSASKTKNFQCGYTYRWTSMPNCWCEDGGGSDDCKYPPTVKFDKTKYYEGNTVHATVSTSQSSVYYKIKDCGGTTRKSGSTSNGKKISYTIPKGASKCCYWQICFYWDEYTPPWMALAGAGGEVTALSYDCTKCYNFYVCPVQTCEVYVKIEDPCCVGYRVYVDNVYQFTEGGDGTTPDGYCAFHVKEGTHTLKITKNGRSASKTIKFECNIVYRWVSMPKNWCGDGEAYVEIKDKYCKGYEVYVDGKYKLTEGRTGTPDGNCGFFVGEGTQTIEIRKNGRSASLNKYFDCSYRYVWDSMPDNWCDPCYDPPIVTFDNPPDYQGDKPKYSGGDKLSATVSTSQSSVYYEIKDCGGTVLTNGYMSNAGKISYTIPTSVPTCCYWTICFYWSGDGGDWLATGVDPAQYYDCIICYTFEVCPICTANVKIDDDTCVGYNVYVDDVYLLTEGVGETLDGYCSFDVTEGVHSIEIRDNECFASITRNFECGSTYLWVSMSDNWCKCKNCPSEVRFEGTAKTDELAGLVCYKTYYCEVIADRILYDPDNTLQVGNVYTVGYGDEPKNIVAGDKVVVNGTYYHNCGPLGAYGRICGDLWKDLPDLIIDDIKLPSKTVCLGDLIPITVTVKNIGGEKANQSVVKYYVGNKYIDRDVVPSLVPNATSNQTFNWTANSCGNIPVMAIADANHTVQECNESNNDKQKRIEASGPDLITHIWPIGATGTVCLGEPITFTVTVINTGDCTAGQSVVKYYAGGEYIDSELIPSLSPGASSTQTFTWTASSCGNVSVRAVADANHEVRECNENNNDKAKSIEVDGPDLIIQDSTLPSGKICLGQPVTITVTVKNEGGCTAGASTVKYFVDNKYVDSDSIPSLDSDAASSQTFTWTADSCGNVSVKAIADANNEVHECDENNNDNQKSIEVDGPDLIIQDITLPSGKICLGQPVTITVTVKNQGGCTAGASTVKYFVDNKYVDSDTVPSLDLAAASTQTFTWTADSCGNVSVKAVADANNDVRECDENNNDKQKSIEVDGPDLIIENITWPSGKICLDKEIEIEVTTANVGKCDAEKPFKVTLYIANNEIENATIASLDAGHQEKTTFSWKPDTCGILSIKAVADVDNTIHECDENNNENQKSIEVDGPDLIIQDISLPPGTICLNNPVNIEVTTENIGKCPATKQFTVMLYVASKELTATIKNLEAGATTKSTFDWVPDACGNHNLKAVADINKDIHECNEGNNENQKDIKVEGPDLIVKEISPASDLIIGVTTDINIVVENQGECSAIPFVINYSIDGAEESTIAVTSSIGPHTTETVHFSWTPNSCDIHQITAMADSSNIVPECDENNNKKTQSVDVKGPDLVVDPISVSSPTTIGSTIKFTVVVKNKGTAAAGKSSDLQCYRDGSALGGKLSVPNLATGQSSTHVVSWTASGCGPHTFKAVADADLDVIECDEENNDKQVSFTVKCPDLIIESITPSSGSPAPNQQVSFSVVVKNKGDADADDSTLKCSVGSTAICTESTGKIPAGKTSTRLCTWTGSGCAEHNFKAVADAVGNKVTESDETNNEKIRAFSVVDNVKPSITIGSPLKGATSGSSTITVEGSASDNSGVAKVEVKVNDGGWEQASGTTSWSKTVSLSEGANTITVKATDVCGNEQSSSITVQYNPSTSSNPDFTISIAPSSCTICAGESATYTVSLTAEDGFSSSVSLSVSGQPSGATAVFDSTSVTPTGSTSLTIDTQTTTSEDTYTITVKGTGDGCTHQATATLIISSEALPNLLVEDISWIPENPESPGDSVDFYITIKNEGPGHACDYPIYVDFIYCENYYDQKKIENGLKSGDTATVIYEGMGAFSCELTAIVDPFDGIEESDEKNNERQETMSINNIDAEFGNIHSEPSGTYKPGDPIQPHIWVKNTGEVTHEFFVSMYIENWYHSKYNDEIVDAITVDSGQKKEVILNWDVPSSAPAGTYSVVFVLWKSRVNGVLEGELAGKTFDPFQIAESDYKNLAKAARFRAKTMESIWLYYNAKGDNDNLNNEVKKIIDESVVKGFKVFRESIQMDPKSGNPLIDGCIELASLLSICDQATADKMPHEKMVDIIANMGKSSVVEVHKHGAAQALQSAGIINKVFDGSCDLKEFIDACNKEAEAWEAKDMEKAKKALEDEAKCLGCIEYKMCAYCSTQYYSKDIGILKEIVGWSKGDKTKEMYQIELMYSKCGGKVYDIYNKWYEGRSGGRAQGDCPVNLHAYDSFGRHVGANEYGSVDLEIPGAYYSGIDSHPQIIQIYGTTDYYFVVEALAQGEFNLTTESHTYEKTTTVQYEHVAIGNDTIAIINLSKEGYTIDIDKDGDNINDYTVDPTTVETNHPPEVSIMAITDDVIFKDDISISYTLKDIDTDICNISARYSTDQMIWHDATMGSGGDGTIGLTSRADGVTHTYVWASDVDLSDISSVVYFEIMPNDGMIDGIQGISNAFYVGEVTASFTYSPSNPTVSKHIIFAAYNSIGNITDYTWNFDDGNNISTNEPIIMHSYISADDYNVILTVTDSGGARNTTSRVVPVLSPGGNDFDTGFGSYPSVMGTHTGTITPNKDLQVSKLYTYPCPDTGGHTEYARIWNTTLNATAIWTGYEGDWHNITFDKAFTLVAGETYNYTIRTGSYPQIHHTDNLTTSNGYITCTGFIDANGKRNSTRWIPAIKLFT
ncbi:hypothetical protein C5S29_15415 [ANME-1 cluster archaeon GoMg3.2]|nr:hypothetical protein [ANME-1 cluster archaeon GoMg3.2]